MRERSGSAVLRLSLSLLRLSLAMRTALALGIVPRMVANPGLGD
jgi:hypothetical protein